MRTRAASLPGLISICMLFCGCAAKAKVEAPSEPDSAFVLLSEQPAQGAIAANDVQPLAPGTETYLHIGEDGQVESNMVLKRESTDRFGATVAVSDNEGRTQFLRTDEQGNILMTAVIEEGDQAISLFDPPLIVAFSELAPKTPRTSQSNMRVVDLKNPKKQKEAGKATRTMTYVSDQRLRTPSGELLAKRIEIHFVADLKLADADETTTLFIIPGKGEVAEVGAETVTVFGAFGKTVRHTLVLDQAPAIAAASRPEQPTATPPPVPVPAHSPGAAPQH